MKKNLQQGQEYNHNGRDTRLQPGGELHPRKILLEKYQNKISEVQPKLGAEEISASAVAHEQKRIQLVNGHSPASGKSEYVGSFVYGGLDGIITTFAIVSGVVGANLSPAIILVLGLANLLGDGFSMAVGAYLSSKSEQEVYARKRQTTAKQIAREPEQERKTLSFFYKQQGYTNEDARQLTKVITRDPGRWVNSMIAEKHLLLPQKRKPLMEGLTTFIAFVIAGSIPLLVYFTDLLFPLNLSSDTAFLVTIGLTALALIGLGAAKVYITGRGAVRSGFEMLVVGALAAVVAYGVGMFLKNLVGLPA